MISREAGHSDTFNRIRKEADATLAEYPQYDGYHDGPEWQLVTVRKNIRTKMGRAFTKNEQAIGKFEKGLEWLGGKNHWLVWSPTNKVHTGLLPQDVATSGY